jgi:hypothetical protein
MYIVYNLSGFLKFFFIENPYLYILLIGSAPYKKTSPVNLQEAINVFYVDRSY